MNLLHHLAIIMDGNGRWANSKGFARAKGHEKGTQTAKEITTYAAKNGVKRLTLYAFSTENWNRPKSEVNFLMNLLTIFLEKELKTLVQNNIRFETIGDPSIFSSKLLNALNNLKNATEHCDGMTQVLALNYGSKNEIFRAIQKTNGVSSIEEFESNLDNATPVDLLIRTGGEMRLSNFLLWQAAYAELRFTNTLWPDFKESELEQIIKTYYSAHRRFGGL